jgi:hypothetical protein
MLDKMTSKLNAMLVVVSVFVGLQVLSLFSSILLTSCFSSGAGGGTSVSENYPK